MNIKREIERERERERERKREREGERKREREREQQIINEMWQKILSIIYDTNTNFADCSLKSIVS